MRTELKQQGKFHEFDPSSSITMMIPKNSRNRRKEVAPRDKTVDESKATTELKTITRSSNHSCSGSNYGSSDVDSQCSWVELDFNHGGEGKEKGKASKEMPVSHVEIAQYLVDDQESNCESNRDRTATDDSSTTSVLSEDFSVENGKNNNSRNTITTSNNNNSKSSNISKIETKIEMSESHDAESVTCSYGSASFADEFPFDDLLNEALIPSNSNLAASITTDDLFPADAIDMSASDRPSSYGSHSQNSMKPSSGRSKGKRQPKKNLSPKPKQSKKKHPSSKSKAAALALRKKAAALEKEVTGVEGASTADEIKDQQQQQHKKKISSKPKNIDAAMSARRRHLHLANAEKEEASNNGAVDGEKESKKKPSPKSTKSTSSSVPSRRRRLRSVEKPEEEDETLREEDETIREESQSSMGAIEDKAAGEKATGDVKKRTERPRKSRSLPHKHRKAPGRSASGKNEGITRNSTGNVGGDRHETDRKREVRKRYKKKHSSSGDNESDEEKSKGSKPRSSHREGKKKIRSKSNESEANSEAKPVTKIDRNSEGKRRKKKKHPVAAEAAAGAVAAAAATVTASTVLPIPLQSPIMVPLKSEHNEEIIFPLPSGDSEQCDEETMEKMTYSFQFDSDDDQENNWLNSNASTSSSLSYNSFAQFSLDVTEVSGHFVSGEITGHTRSTFGGEPSGHAHSICSFFTNEFTGHNRGDLTAHTHSTAGAGFFPETDASVVSFTSNHGDASVVFMAGKRAGSGKNSLLASHSFDQDNEENDDNDGTRSIRSMPEHTDVVKPEKRLRRRLKKKETPASNEDGSSRNKHSSEMKKKVRRTRSGGVERTKSSSSSGKRTVERSRSNNETLLPGGTKVLVHSSARRQENQEKSNRRNKVKSSVLASIASKHAAKSKLSNLRVLSMSPKNKMKGKVSLGIDDEDSDLDEDEDQLGEIIPVNDHIVSLNDAEDGDKKEKVTSSSWRSPKRSPKSRQIRRTFSGPSPSLHPETMPSTPLVHREGRHSMEGRSSAEFESPLSFGSAPIYLDSKKPKRSSASDKKALLGADTEDDSYNSCEDCYSPHSVNSPHDRYPRRGLQRTPSSLLSAVRSHVKNKKENKLNNSRSNMLSMVKKTFSVSGRGNSTFANIADELESRYVSRKERQRKMLESENRKGQIKNSLYACMSDSDDSVEISAELTKLSGENSMNFSALYQESTSSLGAKRHSSLEQSRLSLDKSKMMNSHNSEGSSERPSRPRRVHSLPIGIRRFPPA